MQSILDALGQLLHGQPKQATANLEMLMNSDNLFFSHLTEIIINNTLEKDERRNNLIQKAAIVTLNAMALKCKSKVEIKDFLTVEEIYQCLKKVLASSLVVFQNKKLLTPSLTEFFKTALSTHKEILQLKQQLNISQYRQSSLILLDSIIKTSEIHKPIQIQCITQLFQFILLEGKRYMQAVYFPQGCLDLEISFGRLSYFMDLLVEIFRKVFKNISQPYQFQALLLLSGNAELTRILFDIIEWKNPIDNIINDHKYRYPWFEDLKIQSNAHKTQTVELYEINNLKQKVFLILSSIISKTDPNFNLIDSQHFLIRNTPTLCFNILHDILEISHQFSDLNKDYLIGSLCDSMLEFITQCLNLNDLHEIFDKELSLKEFICCILKFIQIRESDIKSMEDEEFADFLQGFAGEINIEQIMRYGVSRLVKTCCKKIDVFPAEFFETCHNRIIDIIRNRLMNENEYNNQNFYQHLYIHLSTSNRIMNSQNQVTKIDITSCLLGIITIEPQIKLRTDFQLHLIQFFIAFDEHHFLKQELTLLFFILSRHSYLFLNESLLSRLPKLLNYIFQLQSSNSRQSSFLNICMKLIKQIYLKTIIHINISNNALIQTYVNIVYNNIWEMLIKMIDSSYGECEYFYDVLIDVVDIKSITNSEQRENEYNKIKKEELNQKYELHSLMHKNGSQKIHKSILKQKVQTIGDYLLSQIAIFIHMVLQKLCLKLPRILLRKNKQDHDHLIALRLHQNIVQCLQSLYILLSEQNGHTEIKVIQFKQYIQPVSTMIKSILQKTEANSQYQIYTQQLLSLLQLLSIMITQQRLLPSFTKSSRSSIPEQLFESLLSVMIEYPFGETWLICICEFAHRIQGKFDMNEIYKIQGMIKNGYEKYGTDQLKINELSLFVIVLLNYYQPQNWQKIHQIIRVNLIKYTKVLKQTEKEERKKRMLKYGFESEKIFGITTIRLFHVYLFGFKLEANNQLLEEILDYYDGFVEKYCLIQATHFIIGFKSSYRQINRNNFEKLLDILLFILNKLVLNTDFYGNQSMQQARIRKLSQKIGCIAFDPYDQFRSFVHMLKEDGIDLLQHQKHGQIVKNMMNINTYMGQPRKIYSISKKNN